MDIKYFEELLGYNKPLEPFSVETHENSRHFPYFCEVIILKDGTSYYATPSHQHAIARAHKEELDDLWEEIPTWASPTLYLINKWQVVSVHAKDCVLYPDVGATNIQKDIINKMRRKGWITI